MNGEPLSTGAAYLRLAALLGMVLLVAAGGDRILGWAGQRALLSSQIRFSRLYRGDLSADLLVLGNSRAVNALLAPALEERSGRAVRTLAWNGLSAELSRVFWEDWRDRHAAPSLVLIEVSFLTGSNRQLSEFRPYFPHSPRLSELAQRDAPRAFWGCRTAALYCLNSGLTMRALYYRRRSDQGWVNRYRITPGLLAATDTLPAVPVAPVLPQNVAALKNIIAEATAAGTRVRLVYTPYLPAYRRKLRDVEAWLHSVEEALGLPVADYSEALDDPAFFSDRIHLNERGAEALADLLQADGVLDLP
ncbi:MAG: SGNH/GDSL hydrolase family protein [Gemmatimonadota bacterium]